MSYVFTCSNDFRNILDRIVSGLNIAGFSRKDFRVGEVPDPSPAPEQNKAEQIALGENPTNPETDLFDDIDTEEVRKALENSTEQSDSPLSDMLQTAQRQADNYDTEMRESRNSGFWGGELGNMLNQNAMQPQFAEEASALRIPQFFFKSTPDLFGGEYELLEAENLSEGLSLSGQDAQISFELATGEIYRVDLQEKGEAIPKYMRASKAESKYIREWLATLPPEGRVRQCVAQICSQLNRNDRYAAQEISAYVHRVVENMTEDEMAAMETAIPTYARKVQSKIDGLERAYRAAQFKKWLDSGKIVCRESYALPPVITPAETVDTIPYSLYDAEKDDMNQEERNLIDIVVGLGNVRWWHRIIERKGFRLNGSINHYPDFMVMTKAGKLVLIEFKGDDRDNSDSRTKLELGRQWQAQAGVGYRYFMVFRNKDFGIDGAYRLEQFVEIMREL